RAAPAVVLCVFVGCVLVRSGVSAGQVLRFAGYVTVAVLVPGTLLWRFLHRGAGLLVADLAAGFAVGTALQILVYVPARAAGHPALTPVWAVAVIAVFAVVPALRRYWRGAGARRVPLWWAWVMTGLLCYVMAWIRSTHFISHGLSWPENAAPYVDVPFHLALAAELKHHMPPTIPYVWREGLDYYWFTYADLAALSWGTGLELHTLLLRFTLLPQVAALLVLIAALAWRISGRAWTGPAA
ncbi:hypothetical protein, partial [Planomonospora algeriensis]